MKWFICNKADLYYGIIIHYSNQEYIQEKFLNGGLYTLRQEMGRCRSIHVFDYHIDFLVRLNAIETRTRHVVSHYKFEISQVKIYIKLIITLKLVRTHIKDQDKSSYI